MQILVKTYFISAIYIPQDCKWLGKKYYFYMKKHSRDNQAQKGTYH